MKVTVVLSSEPYGNEEFRYDSRRELLAGVARLFTACKRGTREDGIDRDVIIRIETNDQTDCELKDDQNENPIVN